LPTARTRKLHNLTLAEVVSFPDAAEALLERKPPTRRLLRARPEGPKRAEKRSPKRASVLTSRPKGGVLTRRLAKPGAVLTSGGR
jgi:hypothetical protein